MLKMIFFIPLILNYWVMCNMISMLTLLFILIFNKNFFMVGYMMQIDNISFGLIILSIWITFLMIISSNSYKNNKTFSFLVLLLMIFLILSFSSLNLIMFYIFVESSLIPTIIIIMGWGYQPERLIASYYLLFYTLFASLPMLLSIMFLAYFNKSTVMYLMNSINNMYMYM